MSQLAVSAARTYARLRAQDVDATISNASFLSLLNKWYHLWVDEIDPRLGIYVPSVFSGTVGANSGYFLTASPFRDVLGVYRGTQSSSEIGPKLEKVSMQDILRFYSNSQTAGTPKYWAVERIQDTSTNIGKLRVWFYPKNQSTAYFLGHVREYITALANDTDVMDVTEPDAYRVTLLAAAEVAWLIGKQPEFIAGILAECGDKSKPLSRAWQNLLVPRIPVPVEAA